MTDFTAHLNIFSVDGFQSIRRDCNEEEHDLCQRIGIQRRVTRRVFLMFTCPQFLLADHARLRVHDTYCQNGGVD